MLSQSAERRLAAIVAIDVVGFSRLMGVDEEDTLGRLKACRCELIDPKVEHYRGRIFKTTGDGALMEFRSVVDAVRFAVDVQREMAERNRGVAEERAIRFRAGVNLGDVIIEGDDIYGDGVNIAARLEAIAEPGGVYLSASAFEQIRNKLPIECQPLGAQRLKNIAEPVQVYRVEVAAGAGGPAPAQAAAPPRRRPFRPAMALGLALTLAVTVAAGVWFTKAGQRSPAGPAELADSRPVVAVLPFSNLSDDSKQEYFSDGIAEDLITDLSRFPGLLVIARNSTFVYKGRAVDIKTVGRELGARYVLEGSVRKLGDRVRITAQLIDAASNAHLWAERYDRRISDIFLIQDEVTRAIAVALHANIASAEAPSGPRRETKNLDAYEAVLRAREMRYRFTTEDTEKARALFERAIALDPEYARAHAALGWSYMDDWRLWGIEGERNIGRAMDLARKAIALDDSLATAHVLLATGYLFQRRYPEAQSEIERTLALRPTDAETLGQLGYVLRNDGRLRESIDHLLRSMRLDPYYPPWFESWLGASYLFSGQPEEAIRVLRRGLARKPEYVAFHAYLTAALARTGKIAEAKAEAAEILRLNPDFTVEGVMRYSPRRNPGMEEVLRNGLLQAGLPER